MPSEKPANFPATAYDVYQDGKMKRYSLLFAVNGGAFAILQLILAQHGAAFRHGLDVRPLLAAMPFGMIIFSVVMFLDIWRFGHMMRKEGNLERLAFSWVGQLILGAICSLIIAAWLLVAPQKLDLPVIGQLKKYEYSHLIAAPFIGLAILAIVERAPFWGPRVREWVLKLRKDRR